MDWLSSVVSSVSTFLVAAAMSVFSSTSSEPVYTILPIVPMNNTVAETIVYTTPDQIENESTTTLPIATIPTSQPVYQDGVSSSDWRAYQAYTNDRFIGMIRYTNLLHQGESTSRLDHLEKQLFALMDDTSDSLQDIRDDNGGGSIDVTTLTGSTLVSPVFSGAIASNLILGSHYLSGDGGDEGIYIDGSGNVGIGTNSPTAALTVAGTATFRDGLADASNSLGSLGMVLQSTGTSTRWVATSTLGLGGSSGLFTTDIDTSAKIAAILTDETGSGNLVYSASPTLTGTLNAAAATLSSTFTLSGSAANIALGSNYLSGDGGDEGISVSNNGYVSIGTNLELAPLGIHSGAASTSMVIANTNSDARILFSNSTFTNFAGIGMNTNGLSLTGGGDTTLQPHLYINDSGNVGIGTTSALTKIDVVNTSNPASVLVRRTDGRSVRLSAASGESSVLFDNAGPFTIRGAARSSIDGNNATVGTVHLYMSTAGNVGLGTTTPEQVLSVVGNAAITGNILNATWNGSAIGISYGGTGITSYTTGDMLYKSASATIPLAKLPIGTAGQVLQVVGGVPAWVATTSLGIVGGSNFGSFVDVGEMAVADFGSFSCDGFACTVNNGAIDISSQTNLSVGANGLGLASDEIVLSSGFEIPRTASTSDWQTAYGWGNHATAGYALATALSGYLPLTGGTLSGNLTFSGSTANIALGSNYLSGDGGDEGLNIDTIGRISISSLSGSVNPVLTLRNTGSAVNSGNSLKFESGSSVEQASISQVITSVNNSDLYFATRGAGNLNERMRITSVGNIGVGTTTPGAKLTVAGTGEFTDNLTFSGSSANIILGANWLSGDGGDEGVYVDGSGNIGVGTTTSLSRVTIQGIAGETLFRIASSTGSNMLSFTANGNLELGTSGLRDSGSGVLNVIRTSDGLSGTLGAGSLQASSFNSNSSGSGINLGNTSKSSAAVNYGAQLSNATFSQTSITSGPFTAVRITPIYNQVGSTAANTDLLINRTETALGSGSQILFDAQVDGVSRFNIDRTGQIYVLGNLGLGTTTPSSKLTISGDFHLTGAFRDSANSAGTSGMILLTTGTGTQWTATSSLGLAAATALGGYLPLTGGTLSGNLTFSGSTANIALGSNYLSGDGGDEGVSVDSAGNVNVTGILSVAGSNRILVNGTIVAKAGAESSPSYQFDTDGNTGIYRYAADQIGLVTNGTTKVVVDDIGRVGIGSTSPVSLLSVAGDAYITGTITGATWGGATIAATRGGTGLSTITQNQLLIGGAGNTWTQVATSSLGLSASFSNSSQLAALLSDETGTGNAVFSAAPIFTGLATFADLFATNASTTNATTTNLAISSLTSGRVPYVTTSGRLIDSTSFTFGGGMLGVAALTISTGPGSDIVIGSVGFDVSVANRLDLATGDSLNLVSGDIAFGGQVFVRASTSNSSIYIGQSTGETNQGSYNNFIGFNTGRSNTGSFNDFFGRDAGRNNTGAYNLMMGYDSTYYLRSTSSVVLGSGAMRGESGALGTPYVALNNTVVGFQAGYNADTGADNNILIGYQAADNLTTGNNNIIIGYDIDNVTATTDNALNIGNLIFGIGLDGTGTTLSSGNIGIGTSSPTSKLTVDGTILATNLLGGATNLTVDANGNIIRDPSDQRLKKNIVEIDNALEMVLALRGVRYQWRDAERFGTQTEVGFIAQEVDLVVPEVVSKGGDYWSLNTKNLVAVVVEAIKELWKTISDHEDRLDTLEAENAALKARLDAIDSGSGTQSGGNDTNDSDNNSSSGEEPPAEGDTPPDDTPPTETSTPPETPVSPDTETSSETSVEELLVTP